MKQRYRCFWRPRGKRVLVCDLDGQVALTTSVGFKRDVYEDSGVSIYTLIMELERDVNAVIRPAPNDRFDVLPGNIQMYLAEQSLIGQRNREGRLARVFQRIETDYEYILVDCPPALNVVTDNALLACRRVLIPARISRAEFREMVLEKGLELVAETREGV